jgi:hypothetical protein
MSLGNQWRRFNIISNLRSSSWEWDLCAILVTRRLEVGDGMDVRRCFIHALAW